MAAFTTIALIGLSVVGTVQQARAAKKEEAARREGQAIQSASEKIKSSAARQRAAREERLRRARLTAVSSATGTTGSSGQLGASAALGSNFGAARATQSGEINTANALTAVNQRVAAARSSFNKWSQIQGLGKSIYDFSLNL